MKCGDFMPLIDNYLIDNYLIDGPSTSIGIGTGIIFRQISSILQTTATTPVELIGVRMNKVGGNLKVRFSIRRDVNVTPTVYARVYVNDVPYSVTFSNSNSAFILCEPDVSFNAGDKISVYGWSASGGRLQLSGTHFVSDFLTIEREQDGPI